MPKHPVSNPIVPVGQILILREEFSEIVEAGRPMVLAPRAVTVRAGLMIQLLDELIAFREEEAARNEKATRGEVAGA